MPALVILSGYRELLPRRARRCAAGGSLRRDHGSLARGNTRAGAARCAEGGGELYVWTVDDAAQIARLSAMGVDGIITNDPRLFG